MSKEQDTAMYDQPDYYTEEDFNPAQPYGTDPNNFGTTGDKEYPTAIYTMYGEPKAFSGMSFVGILKFAIQAKQFCDEGCRPAVIFTDTAWMI